MSATAVDSRSSKEHVVASALGSSSFERRQEERRLRREARLAEEAKAAAEREAAVKKAEAEAAEAAAKANAVKAKTASGKQVSAKPATSAAKSANLEKFEKMRLTAEMERGCIGAGLSAKKLESGQEMMARPAMRRAITIQTENSSRDPFNREMAVALEMARKGEAKASTTARARSDVHEPLREFLTVEKSFEDGSGVPDPKVIQRHLMKEGKLHMDLAKLLISQTERLLRKEPNLLNLKAPLTVCGDVHGQFYDLVALFNANGYPTRENPYLFLGDYVDRGYFGTEVCFLLFSIKLRDPASIFLLRGNHECRYLTKTYSFKRECQFKYSLEIYDRFCELFDCLPLAALVPTKVGTFLGLHGGISPFINTMDDIREVNRFEEPPKEGALCDILWADPLRTEQAFDGKPEAACTAQELEEWSEYRWMQNAPRGVSYFYGWGALEMFLETNELVAIVRAHEVQQDGYEEQWFGMKKEFRDKRKIPPCITVFSAPNYC